MGQISYNFDDSRTLQMLDARWSTFSDQFHNVSFTMQSHDHNWSLPLKIKLSSGHAIALFKKQCGNWWEKVDHLAYKYWCVLQGSGIIKMIRNLAQSWTTLTCGVKICPDFYVFTCHILNMKAFEEPCLSGNISDVLPHFHNNNDNAHKLFFTSPQNSTFSLSCCFEL